MIHSNHARWILCLAIIGVQLSLLTGVRVDLTEGPDGGRTEELKELMEQRMRAREWKENLQFKLRDSQERKESLEKDMERLEADIKMYKQEEVQHEEFSKKIEEEIKKIKEEAEEPFTTTTTTTMDPAEKHFNSVGVCQLESMMKEYKIYREVNLEEIAELQKKLEDEGDAGMERDLKQFEQTEKIFKIIEKVIKTKRETEDVECEEKESQTELERNAANLGRMDLKGLEQFLKQNEKQRLVEKTRIEDLQQKLLGEGTEEEKKKWERHLEFYNQREELYIWVESEIDRRKEIGEGEGNADKEVK